jgi:hypothetical protein
VSLVAWHAVSWKGILLLSMIIPIGILTGLKVAGIGGPAQVETTVLSPVTWHFEKPSFSPGMDLWVVSPNEALVRNSFENNEINATFIVCPLSFDVIRADFDNSPLIVLDANLTTSVTDGYLENVLLTFNESYAPSQVRMDALLWFGPQRPDHATLSNLTLTDAACHDFRETLLAGDLKAYANAVGVNSPREVAFGLGPTLWILNAPANLSQELDITAQVTYFNGTNHVNVVLPAVLRMTAEVGETLAEAQTITAGSYSGTVADFRDLVDYYKIWLQHGQEVTISTGLRRLAANVSLLDPLGKLVGSVESTTVSNEPKVLDNIEYTVQSDGYWYIRISAIYDSGFYRLIVRVT